MLNWDYAARGARRIPRTREIVDAGLPEVVCPGTNSWNSHGCRLKMGMLNIAQFAAEGLKCGVEGLLNTDWGDNGHRNMLAVSLHNYAWGAAHSWHHRGVREEGFTERFCRDTFGPAGAALPEAIRTLGRADEALGLPYSNGGALYLAFLGRRARLTGGYRFPEESLDAVRPDGLERHRAELADLRWPRPSRGMDTFLNQSLEEYALAARLDEMACRRLAFLKDLRGGRRPSARAVRTLIDETQAAMRELERVWLMGNKPSRLRDNLAGMRLAVQEYRRLARG
jgi:hypothetical protein